MRNQAGYSMRPATAAFTLVELLLTVTLFLLLAAVAVFNFDSLQRGGRLEEGVSLVESLIRYSRAQAAGTGRTLRVVFESPNSATDNATNAPTVNADVDANGVQVWWEIDPLSFPGQFEVMREARGFTARLNEFVEVRGVRWSHSSHGSHGSHETYDETYDTYGTYATNAQTRAPITFYPDGSSDSVEILLVSREPEDSRRLVLTLSGVVGTTRRRWLSTEATDAGEAEFDDESVMEEGR